MTVCFSFLQSTLRKIKLENAAYHVPFRIEQDAAIPFKKRGIKTLLLTYHPEAFGSAGWHINKIVKPIGCTRWVWLLRPRHALSYY